MSFALLNKYDYKPKTTTFCPSDENYQYWQNDLSTGINNVYM